MPLTTPNFSISQNQGAPTVITLTDTSVGSDVNIVVRRVYLIQNNAATLVPAGTTTNYIVWPYADVSISINALTKSTALYIKVEWLDVSNTVLYTLTKQSNFNLFNQDFN